MSFITLIKGKNKNTSTDAERTSDKMQHSFMKKKMQQN